MIYKFTFWAFNIITAIICLSACSTDNANNVEFRLDYTRLQDVDPEAISKKVFKDAQILECSQEFIDGVIDNREDELLAKDGILVVKSLEKFEIFVFIETKSKNFSLYKKMISKHGLSR